MRIRHVLNELAKVVHLPGDVIECGVAAGHTTFPMAHFLAEMAPLRKTLFACDTFAGLPYDDQIISDAMCKAGDMNYGDQFKRLLRAWGPFASNIVVVEGLVEERLPARLSAERFCFSWLDLDLYLPTKFALQFVMDRTPIGGVVGLHDYGFRRCPGIKRAIDEAHTEHWDRSLLPGHCMFLRRLQ